MPLDQTAKTGDRRTAPAARRPGREMLVDRYRALGIAAVAAAAAMVGRKSSKAAS